ncbi:molybdopterin-guanine dinucleotide biosynthesis protein B [Siminovitchia sp. FSL H7-0308]|uniref:Molybdopterin-guanine dinucleotide biosynthesis protein B n=1 Tax=Siminovitchia thermophila TaxID=1245522 RepID=A0ABS2RCL0_9BACI|nr:molybdopterin-guanine dinucleotide biosynthesis protein B [Siminovitchia thermophila]MBM7717382.1 molybdopterin-guanine dinucleotide biosynthesis protein B [Siminovitchia thermophila]ONK22932.1 molybdopterin-guanine dinucleotide biosynthesis protein B [Bacillus sp. VT-16-64]
MAGAKIFQITGYQNSGKTTVMEQLIATCKIHGLKVGTIKHHGHGGFPERISVQKDSEKHRLAGANVTAVEGNGILHIEAQKSSWELEEIIQLYNDIPVDIILVEGYKHHGYPKAVLLRDNEDVDLLGELHHIEAIICREPLQLGANVPLFLLTELEPFLEWFVGQYVYKEKDRK